MCSNKVEYSTATEQHCTTHDVEAPFFILEQDSSKIILHRLHPDNNKGESVIGYDMIIGLDLMVQLGLSVRFKRQVLQQDGATVPMKEPSDMLGQTNLTSREMSKVVIHTEEPVSTREVTEGLVKILDITYAKTDLEQVAANTSQINYEEKTQLLRLLKKFQYLFGGTLGDWDTEPVNLDLKPNSQSFNFKYYPVPRINKENFCKELELLLKIIALTPVQQYQ